MASRRRSSLAHAAPGAGHLLAGGRVGVALRLEDMLIEAFDRSADALDRPQQGLIRSAAVSKQIGRKGCRMAGFVRGNAGLPRIIFQGGHQGSDRLQHRRHGRLTGLGLNIAAARQTASPSSGLIPATPCTSTRQAGALGSLCSHSWRSRASVSSSGGQPASAGGGV